MTDEEIEKQIEEDESSYCSVCDGCGYIGCCGVVRFLEKHVRGKTDCLHEEGFIEEIIQMFDNEE